MGLTKVDEHVHDTMTVKSLEYRMGLCVATCAVSGLIFLGELIAGHVSLIALGATVSSGVYALYDYWKLKKG